MSDIYVVSGFLGSGKTTLINKLLKDNREKVLIVENEVGDRSIDGSVLKRENVDVENLLSGCICCTLAVDFKGVVEKNQDFDKIIIEPSGVAKLSTVIRTFDGHYKVFPITIVEASELIESLEFFGDFFHDQIKNARTLVLNVADENDYAKEIEVLKGLNPNAKLLVKNLKNDDFSFDHVEESLNSYEIINIDVDNELGMDTLTIDKVNYNSREELIEFVQKFVDSKKIYRVKGFAKIKGEIFKVDFASRRWTFEKANEKELCLVVIYKELI